MSKDLTEKEFKKLIQKHIDKIDFVRIILDDESSISGFIVKFSDDFIMIEETYDFSMSGIKILPFERLKSIRHNKFNKVSKHIYSEENLIKFNYKIIDNTSLKNFESPFKSIKKTKFSLHC